MESDSRPSSKSSQRDYIDHCRGRADLGNASVQSCRQYGERAATITLAAACNTAGARQIPSDQPGTRRFERPLNLVPQFSDLRFYTFPGGCVTYEFRFAPGASPILAGTASSAVEFVPRSRLVGYVRQTEGLALCGRGAACPG